MTNANDTTLRETRPQLASARIEDAKLAAREYGHAVSIIYLPLTKETLLIEHHSEHIAYSFHRATAYPDGTVELVHRDAEGNFVRLEVVA